MIHGISRIRITGDFILNRFAANFNGINSNSVHIKRGGKDTYKSSEDGEDLHHSKRHVKQHNFESIWMNKPVPKIFKTSLPVESKTLQD